MARGIAKPDKMQNLPILNREVFDCLFLKAKVVDGQMM